MKIDLPTIMGVVFILAVIFAMIWVPYDMMVNGERRCTDKCDELELVFVKSDIDCWCRQPSGDLINVYAR